MGPTAILRAYSEDRLEMNLIFKLRPMLSNTYVKKLEGFSIVQYFLMK